MLLDSFHEQMTRFGKNAAFVLFREKGLRLSQPVLKVGRIWTVAKAISMTATPAHKLYRNASSWSFRCDDLGSEKFQRLCYSVIGHRSK